MWGVLVVYDLEIFLTTEVFYGFGYVYTYNNVHTCFRNMCLETLFAYSQVSRFKLQRTNEPFRC